jgi:hypothetical protein
VPLPDRDVEGRARGVDVRRGDKSLEEDRQERGERERSPAPRTRRGGFRMTAASARPSHWRYDYSAGSALQTR